MTLILAICYTPEMSSVELWFLDVISSTYSALQWQGVVALMAINSICIPIPSEIIMPLAGWMLIKNQSLPVIYVLAAGAYGALGSVIGSAIAYGIGAKGGRPFLEKYGKYLLITRHDLDVADRWFNRHGSWSIFISRLLPVVHTFISLPAGIARMNFVKFLIFTSIGSFIWSVGLAYGGYQLGEHWERIREILDPFIPVIIGVAIALLALYIYRHVKHSRLVK